MKRNVFSIAMFAVISVLAISCGSGDKSGPAVPKDASAVVHINASSLSKKLTWEEIKATNWFKEAYAQADDTLAKKLLDNPMASGIDIEKDMVFFVKKEGRGSYAVFEGSVKDATAFEAFNKQMDKTATASKSGDLTIMKLKNDAVLSFNASRFVYIANAPGAGAFPAMGGFGGIGGGINEPYKISADSLQLFASVLYDLPSDKSMYKDDRFAATMKEPGDMHVWINNEQTYGALAGGMLGALKINTLFEENATGMALNFDNGKITVKSKQYFNKEVLKLLEKYPAKDISADLVNRIPSSNVVAAIVMNYPPEGLKEFLKLTGLDGTTNGFLQQVGYSIDEFVKANKGEIVVAVSDLTIKADSMVTMRGDDSLERTENTGGTDMKVLFATSINDKPAFDKMVGIIAGQMGNMPSGGGVPKISYNVSDKWFAASNSQDYVNQFIAGGNSKQPFASRIGGQPFGMFVDIQKILASGSAAAKDSSDKVLADESLKMWQDVLVTGGKLKDGGLNYEFEINLVDKSVNSLKQLNLYFDKLSLSKKKNAQF